MQQLTVILIGQYILTAILKNKTNKQGFIYNKLKKSNKRPTDLSKFTGGPQPQNSVLETGVKFYVCT